MGLSETINSEEIDKEAIKEAEKGIYIQILE